MIGGDTYSEFFTAATAKKDGWEPLKQGLFDSSYAEYEELNKRAEEYYKHNRRFYQVIGYQRGKPKRVPQNGRNRIEASED